MIYLDEWNLKNPEIDTAYFASELIQFLCALNAF